MTPRSLTVFVVVGAVCGLIVVVGMTSLQPGAISGSSAGPTPTVSPPNSGVTPATGDGTPDVGSISSAAPSPGSPAGPASSSVAKPIDAKLGRPGQSGTYAAKTAVTAVGDYITWRVIVGPAEAGKTFDVEVGVRLEGTWTGWSKLTSRAANARGEVLFSWREQTPTWIRIRFVLPTGPSLGLQGRWR